MGRTFGWIQDSGSFSNLKRVLQAISPDSDLNRELRETLIPRYIPTRYGREDIISAISGENCSCIPYELLKGSGSGKQLTIEENIVMFGYSQSEAERLVRKGGRPNAACSGIAQLATPAQKIMPNGSKKPYQGDWQAECFVRWAVSLGFIDYDAVADTCKISDLGASFARSEDDSDEEKDILGEALLSYPPACRVMELLSQQGHLTKFEIGRQLGFVGEAGFTSVSQALYVGGISTATTSDDKTDIRQNFEGSSDKYARMIAGWLCNIGWVAKRSKEVTEMYLGIEYTANIGQSYEITLSGQSVLNRIRGASRHGRSAKRVFWNMLATAAPDADYLRNRRYHIIQAIKSTRKTPNEIKCYLLNNGLDVGCVTIEDDIANLMRIGLQIDNNGSGYLLRDNIIGLALPPETITTERSDVTIQKDRLREQLVSVDHRYLVLLDLAYDSNANREFEIETMSLLTDELDFEGLHLGGARRPDGLFFRDTNGVIVDTKAYSQGYNLPITQADEMIRYIEENKTRGEINPNHWWENFATTVESFSYLFVSSEFKGHYQDNIEYINDRTDYDGGVISAYNLLLFAESLLSGALSYELAFERLRVNREITF